LVCAQYGIERCTHAHSHEELEEWIERRRVLSLGDRCGVVTRARAIQATSNEKLLHLQNPRAC
jgi:hypothetical protein